MRMIFCNSFEYISATTKDERTIAAYVQIQKWSLRDTLPLFSQAQVFDLIGHLCYLILQSLRADRQRSEKWKGKKHTKE